jgi:hypothetical protein
MAQSITIGSFTATKRAGGSAGSLILSDIDKLNFSAANIKFAGYDTALREVTISIRRKVSESAYITFQAAHGYIQNNVLDSFSEIGVTLSISGSTITSLSWAPTTAITNAVFWPQPGTNTYQLVVNTYTYASDIAAVTKDITVTAVDYAKPMVTSAAVVLCDADGTENTFGAYFKVQASWTFSSLSGTTTCAAKYKWGELGGTQSASYTLSQGVFSAVRGGSIDPQKTYIVTITLTDTIGSVVEYQQTMVVLRPMMEFVAGANGVAFGKFATTSGVMETAWPIRLQNGARISGEDYNGTASLVVYNAAGQRRAVLELETGSLFIRGSYFSKSDLQ